MTVSAYDAHPFPIFNARYRVIFPILNVSGDLVTGAAGLDSEISQDQGTFTDAANEATEIATNSGMYYLDIISTELDTKCSSVIVKTTTSGAKTTPLTLYPTRLPIVGTGTAAAGSNGGITLDQSASSKDKFYNGCYINIKNNSPANALGQARRIVEYSGSSRETAIEGLWGTNPSNASEYEILLTPEACSTVAWAGTRVGGPNTLGIPRVDISYWSGVAPKPLNSDRVESYLGQVGVGAIVEAGFAADTAKYQAKIWLIDDDGGTADRYVVCWFKNGEPITSGITSPTIQVIKSADGTDLVSSTAMTEIGSLGLYRYTESTNRIVDGTSYIAKAQATIDGSTRTWHMPVGRDS